MQLLSSENGTLWSLAVFIAGLAITFIATYYLNKILVKTAVAHPAAELRGMRGAAA